MSSHFISLIIATKDRPDDLSRLLASLSAQTRRPDQLIVVDASAIPVQSELLKFPDLNICYQRHWPPSASAQRNAGLKLCERRATLIGFVDDDTTFEKDSFEKMASFWASAPDDLAGASFNILNYEMPSGKWLKQSMIVDRLGLYCSTPGRVARSGWQSIFGKVTQTTYVEWLPSGAVLWRSLALGVAQFDEFFRGYSYLEDLDFSFGISRKGKLAVVAEAGYSHFPSVRGRVSSSEFGMIEARNRLYFAKKHRLSLSRCYVGILIRMAMSFISGFINPGSGYFCRFYGNARALVTRQHLQGHLSVTSASQDDEVAQ